MTTDPLVVIDALRASGVKLVVMACNAASTAALAAARQRYPDLPFVGMEPAVKPAAARTRTGAIVVLVARTTALGADSAAGDGRRLGRGGHQPLLTVPRFGAQAPDRRAVALQERV